MPSGGYRKPEKPAWSAGRLVRLETLTVGRLTTTTSAVPIRSERVASALEGFFAPGATSASSDHLALTSDPTQPILEVQRARAGATASDVRRKPGPTGVPHGEPGPRCISRPILVTEPSSHPTRHYRHLVDLRAPRKSGTPTVTAYVNGCRQLPNVI